MAFNIMIKSNLNNNTANFEMQNTALFLIQINKHKNKKKTYK